MPLGPFFHLQMCLIFTWFHLTHFHRFWHQNLLGYSKEMIVVFGLNKILHSSNPLH